MSSLEEIAAARAELAVWHARHAVELSLLPFGKVNWTYDGDAHVEARSRLPVIVMGINPGDGNGATTPGMTPSERAWRTRCVNLTRRPASQIVFSELVSIPTKKIAGLNHGRFTIRDALAASLLTNQAIIAHHQPEIIYQPGLLVGPLAVAVDLYGLRPIRERPRPNGRKGRLLVHYETAQGTPWLSFRHFAAPGFSNDDRQAIQDYVAEIRA